MPWSHGIARPVTCQRRLRAASVTRGAPADRRAAPPRSRADHRPTVPTLAAGRARGRFTPSRSRAAPAPRRRARRGLVAESPRAGDERRARDRRSRARGGRRRRQEPPAAVRGRRDRPQPPADDRPLARPPHRRAALARPAVARPPHAAVGGDAVERAGAPAGHRGRPAARPRPARRRDPRRGRRRARAAGRPRSGRRGRARRPARRRRDREHVARRAPLAGAHLAVAPARRGDRRGARRRARVGSRRDARLGRRCTARACGLPPRGSRLSPLRRDRPLPWARRREPHRVLVRRAASAARPPERAGIAPSAGYLSAWRLARRSSITPCARSRSAPSPISCASSTTRARGFRSRSRSTTGATGRRSTSTGRSSAPSSRTAPAGCAAGRTP